MAKPSPAPTFEPVESKRSSAWYVQIVWPTGFTEHVNGFGSKSEAAKWIETDSAAWLKAKEQGRNA